MTRRFADNNPPPNEIDSDGPDPQRDAGDSDDDCKKDPTTA